MQFFAFFPDFFVVFFVSLPAVLKLKTLPGSLLRSPLLHHGSNWTKRQYGGSLPKRTTEGWSPLEVSHSYSKHCHYMQQLQQSLWMGHTGNAQCGVWAKEEYLPRLDLAGYVCGRRRVNDGRKMEVWVVQMGLMWGAELCLPPKGRASFTK